MSARPSLMKRQAIIKADSAEQNRCTWVTFGPFSPYSMETLLAAALDTVLGNSIGDSPSTPAAKYPARNSAELATPPKPQPSAMPIRSGWRVFLSTPASLRASPAAATANWLQRSSLRAFKGGIKSVALNPSVLPQRAPLLPAVSAGTGVRASRPERINSRTGSTPMPAGVTAEKPVITISVRGKIIAPAPER